jgi:hypothetical protein
MSISTYFKPNIHQNGPEILGVKKRTSISIEIGIHEEFIHSILHT